MTYFQALILAFSLQAINVECGHKSLLPSRLITVDKIVAELDLLHRSVHYIISEHWMSKNVTHIFWHTSWRNTLKILCRRNGNTPPTVLNLCCVILMCSVLWTHDVICKALPWEVWLLKAGRELLWYIQQWHQKLWSCYDKCLNKLSNFVEK